MRSSGGLAAVVAENGLSEDLNEKGDPKKRVNKKKKKKEKEKRLATSVTLSVFLFRSDVLSYK